MNALILFLTNMDARAVRAAGVAVSLLAMLVIGFLIGRVFLDEGAAREALDAWLNATRESGWGLPAVIVLFVIAAFVSAPQTLLIGVVVIAFGVTRGFAYSWIATMCSAFVTFLIGQAMGAEALDRFGGGAAKRMRGFVGEAGMTASFIIRLIPSAPFIVVNMALGAVGVSTPKFLAGTALGIIPKALVVAAIAGGMVHVSEGGDWRITAGLALIAAFWVVVILIARKRLGPTAAVKAEPPSEAT